jgi:hypothetical protein
MIVSGMGLRSARARTHTVKLVMDSRLHAKRYFITLRSLNFGVAKVLID